MSENFTCRRCLKRPNETYRKDPREVLTKCSECGTTNWCLPVKAKKQKKKAEVAESIPTDAEKESIEFNKSEIEAEPVKELEELEALPEEVTEPEVPLEPSSQHAVSPTPLEISSDSKSKNVTEPTKEQLKAQIAEMQERLEKAEE